MKGFFPCVWLRAPETVWPHCLAEPTPWPAGMLRRWVRRPILANDTSKREPFIQDTGALGQSPNPNPPVPFAFLCLRIPVFTKRSGIRLSGSLRISQFVLHCFLQLDNSQAWPLASTSATKVLCVSRIKDLLHLNKDSIVANPQHVCLPRRKSQLAHETTWANKELQTSKRCLHDDKYCSAKTNAALHPKALTPVGQSR